MSVLYKCMQVCFSLVNLQRQVQQIQFLPLVSQNKIHMTALKEVPTLKSTNLKESPICITYLLVPHISTLLGLVLNKPCQGETNADPSIDNSGASLGCWRLENSVVSENQA